MEIADADRLWRRVHHTQLVVDADGRDRVSSAAFLDEHMSVDHADSVEGRGGDFRVTQQSGVGVAEFIAGLARSWDQVVNHDPVPGNEAHSLVIGEKRRPGRRVAKILCNGSILRR